MQHISGTCLWLNAMGWELHVLVGWGKSNHTEFPFDQTHAVCTCAPSQAVPYGETVKEACVIQQGLQDTALCVNSCVCMEKSLVEAEGEKKRYSGGDETSRGSSRKELLYPTISEAKNYGTFGLSFLQNDSRFLCQFILMHSYQQ